MAIIYGLYRGITYWVYNTKVFIVKNIEINGLHMVDIEMIQKQVLISPGQNIFQIDLDEVRSRISGSLFIESAALGRSFPSTIKIDIVEYIPAAYIVMDKTFLINADGYLLPKPRINSAFTDYPIITFSKHVKGKKPGEKVEDPQIMRSLGLLKLTNEMLPEVFETVSSIHTGADGGLSILLSDSGLRIDCGTSDFEHKLAKLKFFLEQHKKLNAGVKLSYINLNYQDQIVVKELS